MAKGITNCESGTGDKGLYVWATYDVAPYRASATPGDASSENIILAESVTSDSIAIYIASTYQFNGDTGTYTLNNPQKVVVDKGESATLAPNFLYYLAYANANSAVIYVLNNVWYVSYDNEGLVELYSSSGSYTKYDTIRLPSKGQQFNGFTTSDTSIITQDGQHGNEWWIRCYDIVSANNCTQGAVDIITFTSYQLLDEVSFSYSLPTLPNRVMLFDPMLPVLQSADNLGYIAQAFADFTTSQTSNLNATVLSYDSANNEFNYFTTDGERSTTKVSFAITALGNAWVRPGVEYALITMA